MNAAILSPVTPASALEATVRLLHVIPVMVCATLLGLVVFVLQTLAIVLFPIGALGYGAFWLARRLSNRMMA